jgi:protein N-terminal methyltransferase
MNEVRKMWKKPSEWYAVGRDYWERQEASDDGVLGGFGRLNSTDVSGSRKFMEIVEKKFPGELKTAVDCGAGIGRVSRDLLLKMYPVVDLVEPSRNLLEKAKLTVPSARNFLQCALQDFTPAVNEYDIIWIQWVLLYLTDSDLVEFLRRCKLALRGNGVICFKENTSGSGECIIDTEDCSLTRTPAQYRALVTAAGLKVEVEMRQSPWPSDLYPVVMFACR